MTFFWMLHQTGSMATVALLFLVVNLHHDHTSAFAFPSSMSAASTSPGTTRLDVSKTDTATLPQQEKSSPGVGLLPLLVEQHVRHLLRPHSNPLSHTVAAPGTLEVDRYNLHPLYKWGFHENLPIPAMAASALFLSPILLPALPLIIAWRKLQYDQEVARSKAQHRNAFVATTIAYRCSQKQLMDQLIEAQQKEEQTQTNQQPLSSYYTSIGVTMATGQEGQGVVRSLVEAPQFQNTEIVALVRNPSSESAQALARLSPRVRLVQCDSTSPTQLQHALSHVQAVYLCTTLNQGHAGHWSMSYQGGGQYQIQQGQALAAAFTSGAGLPHLKQVVYGTAPLRKWPANFKVEPPIHYAAKWRVEEILTQAGVPLTCLRKCPYHENFTKLTNTKQNNRNSIGMGVQGGDAFDGAGRNVQPLARGHYHIKAFTTPTSNFTYNMMDPRDAGTWAVVCFTHPSILLGQSLSAASDALMGPEMAQAATDCGAMGKDVIFSYRQQPRWLFEALSFVEPTFVYISGLQRWTCDGGVYDLDADGVQHARNLVGGRTWCDHLKREGLGQFTETMADLLPDVAKVL